MPLQSRALRAFMVVAEELHFGNAARRLNISQPPLSQLIRRFEAELGVTLFVRSTRSVHMTPAGELLHQWARQQAADETGLVRHLQQVSTGDTGTINLGFSSSVAYRLLPRLLGAIHAQRPGLDIILHEGHSLRLIDNILDSRLDIALLRRPAATSFDGLLFSLVETEPFLVALPAGHPLAQSQRISVRRLHQQPFIDFEGSTAMYFRERTRSLFAQYQVRPNIVTESAMPTVLALVQAGMGLALVPACAHVLYSGEIEYRPLAETNPLCSVEMYSVRKDHEPSAAVRVLEETLHHINRPD
ncbi:LysR family transcriptional regulator [Allopusillimonas soli]|uniref:LysR family transcriptional regulator n=1 Tax=Allopusillimonas soli TaxID=659016 RepID=A0A853FBD9_9BURK|nr:LysR substrate-binding domain-containing protein [Allopusillimonas soli]NYT35861.1 LysR family transcriptional regulator [Allopusillimonas soli]TEA76227.1 LysR family transcriptional regulator [Allopusillimonas soli]